MILPQRVFYSLFEAAARWGCMPADIADWAAISQIEMVTSIPPTCFGSDTMSGIVAVAAADILPMFRRDGAGPEAWPIRRVRGPGQPDAGWKLLLPDAPALMLSRADLLIMTTEARRFEDACGMSRRVSGQGPSPRYDWDGFYLAIIRRIHEFGLPETQADLVTEMQNWFIGRSRDGDAPEESTIRKRIMPIWQDLRKQA